MEKPYTHAEINSKGYYVWSDHRLVLRFTDLEETQKVRHNERRLQAIKHEMACIAFELVMRELDEQKREFEIVQLEELLALDPFGHERVEDEQKPEDAGH